MLFHSGMTCACAEVLSWGAISETPVFLSSPTSVSFKAREHAESKPKESC